MSDTLLFEIFGVGVILTLIVGFYCVLVTRNLIRALIGIEVLTKAVTLLLILCGYVSKQLGLAQALAITLIVIEVAVMVVGVAVVLCFHRRTGSIDASDLRTLKG